jgi:hypothetical protein
MSNYIDPADAIEHPDLNAESLAEKMAEEADLFAEEEDEREEDVDGLTDARADHDALAGAGLGDEGDFENAAHLGDDF